MVENLEQYLPPLARELLFDLGLGHGRLTPGSYYFLLPPLLHLASALPDLCQVLIRT